MFGDRRSFGQYQRAGDCEARFDPLRLARLAAAHEDAVAARANGAHTVAIHSAQRARVERETRGGAPAFWNGDTLEGDQAVAQHRIVELAYTCEIVGRDQIGLRDLLAVA